MDGAVTLVFLSFTMLIGSLISGLLPLTLTLSEVKMRHITVLGAGLLIGTALAVIIPEGIHSLNSVSEPHQDHLKIKEHVQKRSVLFPDLPKVNLAKSDGDFLFMLPPTSSKSPVATKTTTTSTRFKRHEDEIIKTNESLDKYSDPQSPIKEIERTDNKEEEKVHSSDTHGEHQHSTGHSGIGVSLVLGFIFMLVIDHVGGKYGHGHSHQHQLVDNQTIRNKITFSTTLGLVVHAAADGIALGAASSTNKSDVEMIVFFAIMLHKAPAAFGLVSFLIHEGLDRARIRRHLMTFAIAAPAMAILTFIFLKSKIIILPPEATGYCMLFSAGTFLYVSTVHVLPEIQSHNEDRQFNLTELVSFIVGAIIPVFLAIGHHH